MFYSKYFENNEKILKELERLHKKKYELKKLLNSSQYAESYVVEFSGLPRTGKSSSIERVYDFFKKANFKVEKTEEPAAILKKTLTKEQILQMSNLEFNNKTLEISRNELSSKLNSGVANNIIIQDRGVVDNYFWYQMMYDDKIIDRYFFDQILMNLPNDLTQIDQLFIMTADSEIIILRDYVNQIYLEERKKTTIDKVEKLRKGFMHLLPIIENQVDSNVLVPLDTSSINEIETSIFIADKMMDGMTRKLERR